jgi:hypothetical protein
MTLILKELAATRRVPILLPIATRFERGSPEYHPESPWGTDPQDDCQIKGRGLTRSYLRRHPLWQID